MPLQEVQTYFSQDIDALYTFSGVVLLCVILAVLHDWRRG